MEKKMPYEKSMRHKMAQEIKELKEKTTSKVLQEYHGISEYAMIVNMLQRVDPDGSWHADPERHIITLTCDDGWYDRTFIFNEEGELVEFD